MRLTSSFLAPLAFAGAACLSWLGGIWGVTAIESVSAAAVAAALKAEGAGWASVAVDGLQVQLSGTAPTEADRFHAISVAGAIIDATRVIDGMQVAPGRALPNPRYSVEVLRNDDGISLIGLIPSETGRGAILAQIADIAAGATVTDMLEVAENTVPEGWDQALVYGLSALKTLPRSKISIAADRVAITAISDSAAAKRQLESDLGRTKPDGLTIALNISAPRPVITPFTLRFLIDAQGARFDACSADTEAARATILRAATAAGMTGTADCVIGLGVPTPNWAEGVATAIAGLAEMGGGALTFSDADISLVAGPSVTAAVFDRVVGDLGAKLPEVFSLSAVMPEKAGGAVAASGPAEFTATLAEDGRVELRGRLPDERVRVAVDRYARARFGSDSVYAAPRLDDALPQGWPIRVLAGLEAMGELQSGDLRVQADALQISGVTGNPQGAATIARILSEKLGAGQDFKIAVRYDKALDPNADLPTPAECAASINEILGREKISFAPGKAEIEPASFPTLGKIARILARCGAIPMEIGGHTDAQGRDSMNLALSQSRAEAVRQAMLERGVVTVALTAKGYGETLPIADNKTDDGREANRRIEFHLLLSDAQAAKVAAETVAADAAAPDATAADAGAGTTTAGPQAAQGGADAAAAAEQPVLVRPAAENQTRPKQRPDNLKTTLPEQSAPAPTLPERGAPAPVLPEIGATQPD